MNFDLSLFLRALGLAMILEGALWSLFPRVMRRAMRQLLKAPVTQVISAGLTAVLSGLFLVWLGSRS